MKSAPQRFRFTLGKIILIIFFLFVLLGRWLEPFGNKQSALVQATFRPIFSISNIIWRPFENIWQHYFYLVGLKTENERLKKENAEILQQLVGLQNKNLFSNSQDLKELYKGFYPKQVELLSYDPVDPSLGVWINQGGEDGLSAGQIVVASEGLVGILSKVFPKTAKVIPIISPNSSLDVEIIPSGARGILKGEGKQLALDRRFWTTRIEYLGNAEKINEGDTVTTSGLDKVFPKGLVVGKIQHLNKDGQGLFVSAEVLPEVDFSKLRTMWVLIP